MEKQDDADDKMISKSEHDQALETAWEIKDMTGIQK